MCLINIPAAGSCSQTVPQGSRRSPPGSGFRRSQTAETPHRPAAAAAAAPCLPCLGRRGPGSPHWGPCSAQRFAAAAAAAAAAAWHGRDGGAGAGAGAGADVGGGVDVGVDVGACVDPSFPCHPDQDPSSPQPRWARPGGCQE